MRDLFLGLGMRLEGLHGPLRAQAKHLARGNRTIYYTLASASVLGIGRYFRWNPPPSNSDYMG